MEQAWRAHKPFLNGLITPFNRHFKIVGHLKDLIPGIPLLIGVGRSAAFGCFIDQPRAHITDFRGPVSHVHEIDAEPFGEFVVIFGKGLHVDSP